MNNVKMPCPNCKGDLQFKWRGARVEDIICIQCGRAITPEQAAKMLHKLRLDQLREAA